MNTRLTVGQDVSVKSLLSLGMMCSGLFALTDSGRKTMLIRCGHSEAAATCACDLQCSIFGNVSFVRVHSTTLGISLLCTSLSLSLFPVLLAGAWQLRLGMLNECWRFQLWKLAWSGKECKTDSLRRRAR